MNIENTSPYITVIIPAKDESASLRELSNRILAAYADNESHSIELLFIDDGSSDNTWEILNDLHNANPAIRALRFNKNQGKSAALAAGIAHARGEILVTIDADLQDEPAEIPKLVAKLDEGYDLVSGWKKDRQDPWHKRWFSLLFNGIVSKFAGITLHDINCGLKAYRKKVFEPIRVYGELHRFIPVLAARYGFRIAELPVTHHPRKFGKSRFGTERILRAAFDFLSLNYTLAYLHKPMHWFGTTALLTTVLGLLFLVGSLLFFFFDTMFHGAVIAGMGCVLGIFGLQAILFGWLAESLIYVSRRDEPPYYINEIIE